MLPSHPQGPESAPTVGVIVLIITCAKAREEALVAIWKNKTKQKKSVSMLQLVFHHASPFARRCFEGSIVFTGVVGILISLSLEIPCACCGLCWTVPTPTAPRHFFFPSFVSYTLVIFQKAESCVETAAYSHGLLCISSRKRSLLLSRPPSLLPSLVSKSRSFCLLDASCG